MPVLEVWTLCVWRLWKGCPGSPRVSGGVPQKKQNGNSASSFSKVPAKSPRLFFYHQGLQSDVIEFGRGAPRSRRLWSPANQIPNQIPVKFGRQRTRGNFPRSIYLFPVRDLDG